MQFSKNKNRSSSKYRINRKYLIEQIKNDEMNNECFDCGSSNPEYISINNGIFICKKCIYNHFKFPDEISKLLKNNLESLKQTELCYLYYGGNKRLSEYLYTNCPKLNKYQPELLYESNELKYYRDKLANMVSEKDLCKDKSISPQRQPFQSMTEKRVKSKYNSNIFNERSPNINNMDINNDMNGDNNTMHNNKRIKRKYNEYI